MKLTLTFEEAMLFALGRCAHFNQGELWPCRLQVLDPDGVEPTPESRYCGAHQPILIG